MEEKKTKEVKMNASKGNTENQQKLSYEELNNICMQLQQQNQYYSRRLREAEMLIASKRIDYLFKAIELEGSFKDAEFINACMEEIKASLFDNSEEETKEEK